MVVPGDGGWVTVPCLLGRHFPNGSDLVAIMALEGLKERFCYFLAQGPTSGALRR